MNVACLDLEGVLVPEIWIAVSRFYGISELAATTRDEPNYDTLMAYRLAILEDHDLGLKEIQTVISAIKPLEGAREFLDELKNICQVIILSDTFEQFTTPLMRKLGMPTILCNTLNIGADGKIIGYEMRIKDSKLQTVRALQSIGCDAFSCGDSYNDIDMIRASKAGFLFRSTDKIIADNSDLAAYNDYDKLLNAFRNAMGKI